MDPASSGSQSAQPNWSELLSKASQGSSLFIKGEGKQVSYIAISMLDSAPDKSIEEGYKKLSIQQIVEISKSCLNQDSTQIDENIRIKSQVTDLLEIESTKLKETIGSINDAEAKKTIEGLDQSKKIFELNQDETDFLQALKKYGAKDLKGLIEIAKKAATQSGSRVSQFIQGYGIQDKQVLIEIAKKAAAQDGWEVSEYIKNYGIKEKQALIEIAKIAAAQRGWGVSQFIQNYGIEDKQVLIEIAKIAAAQSGLGVSLYIQSYGIEDKQVLIEIAKIAAAQDGRSVSKYIERYVIKDQNALTEIAKIALAQSLYGVSEYIQNYGIKDQEALIEIAKIAAAQSGERVSAYIKNYGIKEESSLIEIAKIASAQNGEGVSEQIQKYGIKEENALFSIFLNAMSSSPDGALKFFSNYKLTLDFFPELINSFILLRSKEADLSPSYESINSFCKEKEWILPKEIFDTIMYKGVERVEKKSPEIQKIMLTYLTCFLVAAALENLTPGEFKFLIENGFLKAAFNYTNPNMRYKFINPMIELTKNDKAKAYALKLLNAKRATISKESVKSKKPEKSVNPPHARVPMMLLALLETQGVPENICDAQYKIACMNLFKPGKENRFYVNALYSIFLSKELDSGDKANLIKKIDSKETLVTLRAISTIKDLNKMADLKEDNLKKKTISAILEEKIQELIPTKEIADFAEKFTKTFGESRVPNYIITYAAKLQTENQSLQCLGSCLDGLLAGDFLKNRYDILKSKHLTEVFREKPELLIEWKGGKNASLSSFLTEADVSLQPINFFAIFKDNLIDHGHLKYEDAPILFDFLKYDKEVIQENLENDKLKNMQKKCTILMDKSLSAENQKKLLKEIDSDLKEINKPEFEQFKTDIKDLFSGLIKREEVKKSYSGYSIVDTDDYQDLFLSGTEVEGSCQNVDGTASLNKCLIAYVFDGKNRLLAVKDKDGKIIARQIFRILLNGKEPVLFLERVYPSLVDPKLKLAIEEFGKKRAEVLGLPLLTIDPTKPKYEGSISSLSTLDPILFEYSDAGDGHVTNGTFTISSPNYL